VLPVLIACKWKMLGYWTLFDLEQHERPMKNCKYTFERALKNNLLGVLAGDFMFVLKKGVGLHIKARKLAKLGEKKAENSLTEEFHVKIEDAFFTNGLGQHVSGVMKYYGH
jgi:hypothetical protein